MPELVGHRKVRFSKAEVIAFKQRFPCSGLRDRSYWFEFASNGDLVDHDVPQHDDGPGSLALSKDAGEWLEGVCAVAMKLRPHLLALEEMTHNDMGWLSQRDAGRFITAVDILTLVMGSAGKAV